MIRRPPRSTRTDTLFPYTTLFRSNGKVSHIWSLRDDGQHYRFNDPWLPRDDSYEMCGPQRGQFRGVNLSASGSTIFTINRYGDLYTRHYDFDLSGDDSLFFEYARSEEHTSELQSLMRISYAVFC